MTNASSYSVQLYKGGTAQGAPVFVTGSSYDFSAAITTAGTGSYTFKVTAVGNGTTYTNSDSATSGAYAYTTPAAYTVTLNLTLDGGAYAGQTMTMQQGSGTVYTLTGTGGAYTNTAVPNGTYTIYKGGVSTGKTVTINGAGGSATLDFFTVSFVANGGTPAPASQIVIKDGYATAPAAMTYGTMALSGWYASSTFAGSAWGFATNAVTATTTLYAKWVSSDKAITAYSINSVNGTIDETAGTIAVTLPTGTNVTALAASFTASANAAVTVGGTAQVSGTTTNNFTSPVTYTVTAQDNTTKTYVVTVTVPAAPAALAFTDSAAYDIPAGTISTAIIPIDVSGGASGGTTPYTFSLKGAPSWLSITAAGGISGTRPATAQTAATATVKVTDSASPADSKSITIAVGAVTASPTPPGPSTIPISIAPTATFVAGNAPSNMVVHIGKTGKRPLQGTLAVWKSVVTGAALLRWTKQTIASPTVPSILLCTKAGSTR